jgi:DNA topoisomerase-2
MSAIKLKINNSSNETNEKKSISLAPARTPISLKINTTPSASSAPSVSNTTTNVKVVSSVPVPSSASISLKLKETAVPVPKKETNKNEEQLMSSSSYSRFKDQRDHVYNIPDTYVGSSVQGDREERVLDLVTFLFKKSIIRIPEAVERIFIEILSNAGDNSARSLLSGIDPGEIIVTMTDTTITIRNGGIPIPVEIHKEEKIYVPELIFGNLMSSSSYDKNKKRQFSSRNGFGSKLTNIFSKMFKVTVADAYNGLLYSKVWTDNMKTSVPHSITPYDKENKSFVEIEFTMDFKRFGYEKYPQEAYELYARHIVDTAFTLKIPVSFNGKKYNIATAKEYAKLYLGKEAVKSSILYYAWPEGTETVMKKNVEYAKNKGVLPIIEICAVDSPDCAERVAFVNNMWTRNGGVHYEAAFKAVTAGILKTLNESNSSGKKKKESSASNKTVKNPKAAKVPKTTKAAKLTIADVKKHVSLFVNCWIEDPIFDSQSKNELKSPTPKVEIDEKILNPIMRWELVARLYAELDAKLFRNASKSDGKKKRHLSGMGKLEDANLAGTSESTNCTLYVTEGDSAQTFANKLLSYVPSGKGRDYIGTYPLKGKPLNVMNAPALQINENKEINDLKKILGLREGVDYMVDENYQTLRYGHVMVAADSDFDGSHILGLVMNLFFCKYPTLLARGYVTYLRTKILEVKKGSETVKFYSHHEYELWKNENLDFHTWKHSYYKGLGTNLDVDIEHESKAPKIVMTVYDELAPQTLRLAFDSKLADNRKLWISSWVPDYTVEQMMIQPISSFINHQFIQYSLENIARSIPRFTDGLKISQRKIIWASVKRWGAKTGNNADKMKVAQFGAYVADKCMYNHGEKSLTGAVVSMAQDFVGANNLPYFTSDGQYGSRNYNGIDAADSRYLFTRPFPLMNVIFRKEDVPILTLQIEEGETVEPVTLLPILPMHLINGQIGVATAFSTYIPGHDPLDCVYWYESRLKGLPTKPIIPWYRGFEGEIKLKQRQQIKKDEEDESNDQEKENEEEEDKDEMFVDKNTQYTMIITGNYEEADRKNKITITEIPIGRTIHGYKEFLDKMREDKVITKYDNYSTPNKPVFEVYGMKNPSLKNLKLIKTYGLSNMVLIDDNNKPHKYDNTELVLETFYHIRLAYYSKRKTYILKNILESIELLNAKIKFILAMIKGLELLKSNPGITDEEANIQGAILAIGKNKKTISEQMGRCDFDIELIKKVTIHHCTEEEVQSLKNEIVSLEAERKEK